LVPNSFRHFQASLRANRISNGDASVLASRLLAVCANQLARYDGYFAPELREGNVGRILRQSLKLGDYRLREAHQNLSPDDLYAELPWPCRPQKDFRPSEFLPPKFEKEELREFAAHPFPALAAAIETTNLGFGFGLTARTILTVLDWLDSRCEGGPLRLARRRSDNADIISIPALRHGLQGLAVGLFRNLNFEQKTLVQSLLREFAETMGEKTAQIRAQNWLKDAPTLTTLENLVRGVINLLPPIRQIVIQRAGVAYGLRLQEEADYLAGFLPIPKEDVAHLVQASPVEPLELNLGEQRFRVFLGMLENCEGLNPDFTGLRMRMHLDVMLSQFTGPYCLKPLSRPELDAAAAELERRIEDKGRGAVIASHLLYLLCHVREHYNDAEMIMTNVQCRKFMKQRLGWEPKTGYQVGGNASGEYASNIEKILPGQFRFEPRGMSSLRACWQPQFESEHQKSLSAQILSSAPSWS
jgi:hypothetical protein